MSISEESDLFQESKLVQDYFANAPHWSIEKALKALEDAAWIPVAVLPEGEGAIYFVKIGTQELEGARPQLEEVRDLLKQKPETDRFATSMEILQKIPLPVLPQSAD